MAKKSIKEAAAAGTSVFDQIARGNTTGAQEIKITGSTKQEPQKVALYIQEAQNTQNAQSVEDALYTQDTKDATDVKGTLDVNKEGVPLARLNLKIPAELKEYLTVAAAKASIKQRRNISLTEYLCQVVREDMERHKDD